MYSSEVDRQGGLMGGTRRKEEIGEEPAQTASPFGGLESSWVGFR